ncbi:hypothetical protein HYH08_01735 [Bradyrhizobium sp. BR 10289]|nr:hypothetical protein [Bradyrhizobium sp. BR 10289]
MKARGSAGRELRQAPGRSERLRMGPAKNTMEPDLPPMPPEKRPQDPYMNGRDLRFVGYRVQTGEHAGEYPDTMPQLIEVTDAEGRKAAYVPLSRNGKVVDTSDLVRKLREADVIASRAPSDPHAAS